MRSSKRSSPSRLGLAVVALVAAACGSGATPAPSVGITVSDAWVRLPAAMGDSTAAYLTITGGSGDDALVGASSDVASAVGLHQSTTDSSGMTGMHPVDRIEVPAGATVKLEPGGYHVMLDGLTRDPAAGETVRIELTFEHAGTIVVQAAVRAG